MKGELSMNQFNVTMNKYAFTQKPTDEQTKTYIRPYYENQIVPTTIHQLAEWINQGYSFHANVLDYNRNTSCYKGTTTPTKSLNGSCFVPEATTLISIDVDHGNMTLEELKMCMASVPHALVYKTFSYSDALKKYRVLFIANRPFKDVAEFKFVQSSLIYLFAHPFKHRLHELESKVDFSVKDSARISYAGTVIETEIHDRTFDLDLFIRQAQQLNTPQLSIEFAKAWKQEMNRREGKEVKESKTKTSTSTQTSKTKEEREEVMTQITKGLTKLTEQNQFPKRVSFNESIDFINQLSLADILEEPVGIPMVCYLPDHAEENASAYILTDDNDRTRYYCFGCNDGHALSTFDFIEEVMVSLFHYDRYTVIKSIFSLLNIRLKSEYQEEAFDRLQMNRDYLDNLDTDNELLKHLKRKNLFTLYETMMNLCSSRLPLQSVTTDKTNELPSFFASVRNINFEMKVKRNFTVGHSSHSDTNDKLIELVRIGLLQRVKSDEIDTEMFAKSQEYRERLIKHEVEVEGRSGKEIRHMDYYMIPTISLELERSIMEFLALEKKYNVKKRGRSMKQTKALYGNEKAGEVYTQSELVFSKRDEKFIKEMNQRIDELLETQKYFTEKQLNAMIDKKSKYIKSVKKEVEVVDKKTGQKVKKTETIKKAAEIKQELLDKFLSSAVKEKELTVSRVNKETRTNFNIPTKVSSNSTIYFK